MKGITKEEALQIIADHIELGEIKSVKHDDGTYSVFAVCSDGLLELNQKCTYTSIASRRVKQTLSGKMTD